MNRPYPFEIARLYLAAHGSVAAIGAIAVVAVLNWRLGDTVFRVGRQQPVSVPLMTVIPVAFAASLVVLTSSRTPMIDQVSARSLTLFRLANDLGGLALAVVALQLSSPSLTSEALGSGAGLRNLIGLTGLAWLASAVLGNDLAWIPPVVLALVAMIVGLAPTPITGLWSWLLVAPGMNSALIVALLLLAAGTMGRAANPPTASSQVRPLRVGRYRS